MSLLDQAGAVRIRLLESPWKSAEPLEEYMISAGSIPQISAARSGGYSITLAFRAANPSVRSATNCLL